MCVMVFVCVFVVCDLVSCCSFGARCLRYGCRYLLGDVLFFRGCSLVLAFSSVGI